MEMAWAHQKRTLTQRLEGGEQSASQEESH
jgi:hypothetical protein